MIYKAFPKQNQAACFDFKQKINNWLIYSAHSKQPAMLPVIPQKQDTQNLVLAQLMAASLRVPICPKRPNLRSTAR